MKVNPQIFRAYDIRGVIDKDLSAEFYEHLGKAYGTYLKRNNIDDTSIVSRDARATSAEYSNAFVKGVTWAGVDVLDIGMTLVGNFYWSQYYLKHKGGVFITASHNPRNYNGAKLSVDYSETMVSHQIQEMRKLIEEEDYDKGERTGEYKKVDIKPEYISDMKRRVKMEKPIKVLIDTSYSTGGAIVPDVFKAFGLEVIEKHTTVDATHPFSTPDPTDVKLAERLAKETKEAEADVGFTYDSDGDRIGVVDEKGQIIWNDMLVALFSVEILRNHPGSKIMFNSLCSRAVSETIEKHGGVPFMWRTGHSFLKKKNQEVGAAFIGELSGHFFFSKDFYNHDDGIYSSLRLISYLSSSDKKLSELVAQLPQYISSPEIKVGYPDEKKEEMIKHLAEVLKKNKPDATVIDDESVGDGVRLETDTSMFIVRYSQNGPYLTIKFEADTKDEYESLRVYINELLHSYPEVDWSFGVNVESLEE